MAADWVNLFDLDLAKAVVRLDRPGLERFLAERGGALVERDQLNARLEAAERVESVRVRQAGDDRAGAREAELSELRRELEVDACRRAADRWKRFAEFLRAGEDLESLRAEIALAAGTLSNDLILDYWGCFVEVLMPLDVERTCESNLVLEGGDADGAHVYFLEAPHADAMIRSLRDHWSEVTLMKEPQLQRLVEYRDRCASDASLRIAYHIDF